MPGSYTKLFHGTSNKLQTTNTGVVVTGILTATSDISIPNDTGKIKLGASQDLEINHNGTHSFIKDAGTGSLFVLSDSFKVNSADASENMIVALENSFVKLFFNGSNKLETTNTGITVTGTTVADGADINGDLDVSGTATLGSGGSGQAILQYQGSTKLTTQTWGVQASGTIQSIGNLEAANTVSETEGKQIHIKNLKSGGGVKNVLTLDHASNNSSITGHVGNISINAPLVSISTNFSVGTDTALTIGAVSSHHLTVANDNASMILGKSNSDALYLRREYATGRYTFQTFNGGNDGSIALQPSGGKVGIASAIPTSTLDVNGDVRVGSGITLSPDGNIFATGITTSTTFVGALTGNVTGNASGSSGSCTGNAATATALETARTIAGVSFDGSANISLNNNAITNGAGYITATLTDEEVQDKVGAMFTGNTETGITATYQDADGTIDLVVGTLNQDTTGNAATATALETARNIGGVSFDGSANIDLPGVNSSGNQDTSGNAATATKLAATKTIAGVAFDGSANISLNNNAITNGAGYITATLTNEQVQDIVGGMVSSNTESGITVTYQDDDGTLDFSVGTLNQDTTGTAALAEGLTGTPNIACGTGSFTGNLSVAQNIVHTGNTDTKIEFSTNTITFDTVGSERLRIDANGNIGINVQPRTSSTIFDNTEHFLVIGDNDTGIAQDGDGELELWANNQEIVNLNTTGVTFTKDLTIPDKIIHSGDTDTAIRFPDDDTVSVETAGTERMKIQSNGEIAMRSSGTPSDALANLHVQNDTFRVSNDSDGADTTYIALTAHTNATDGDRNIYKHVSNDVIMSQITHQGQFFGQNSIYAGRTRTDQASPSNVFRNGSHSFVAYSGTTNNTAAYRGSIMMRAWDGGDTGDRNILYYADSGSDTTALDYDQHQYFGVKANGMTQIGSHLFAGRVESDEASPNSVYRGANGTAIIVYPNSASQFTRIDARTSDNTEQVYKADTGGGVVIKFQSNGNGRFDGGADIGNASDYAEYFEWTDGNTSGADRRGMTVVMDGEKIRPATDSDDTSKIIGVVSANPAVVGDSAWSEWQLAHLKDAYGSWVTEDKEYLVWNKFGTFTDTDGVKKPNPQPDINNHNMDSEHQCLVSEIETEKAKGNVPQEAIDQNLRFTRPSRTYNPDYDKTRNYVPRSERNEWDAIGLMGKLVVRRGQPIGANWIIMKSNVGTDPNDNSIILDKYLVR